MGNYSTFEDLDVWKKAHKEIKNIYKLTNKSELSKDFSLKDQIRRSAISITSNIAEGHDRKSNKEFLYFLNVAKGSCSELRSQLFLAKDLNYITEFEHSETNKNLIEVNKMIFGLMKYLQTRN